ncbi:MAG: methyltransferase domain-containing protein [Deltaproteobacteria bacterium]|nr:methyltransferase domain-containing protein [Deltaproteobacteria bacterium]
MTNCYNRPIGEHDWHSREYVDNWIERDVTRDNIRRPLLQQMLTLAPFTPEAEINVLDVGAGYGLVSEQVLRLFPRARVTLQDYSAAMFEHARSRLRLHHSRISYVISDLRDPGWTGELQVPFDLIVSGLAIHNLREPSLMQACYRSIYDLLRPGRIFLDYDLFGLIEGGVDTHRRWLHAAGFERTERTWEEPPLGIIAAWVREA